MAEVILWLTIIALGILLLNALGMLAILRKMRRALKKEQDE